MNTSNLAYFIDKVVTILTVGTAKNFPSDEVGEFQHSQYFTGLVKDITNNQIWVEHLIHKTISVIFVPHVVGIFEEMPVSDDHPEAIKAKNQDEARRKAKVPTPRPMPKPKESELVQLNLDKVLSLGKV